MLDFGNRYHKDITDDFDPDKIIQSGQCFRASSIGDGVYRFITGSSVLYICREEENSYSISCTQNEWNDVWVPYFNLERSYSDIRHAHRHKLAFVDEAMEHGKGLRILKQDPWEMLITFIISQRKSIPAITKCVETIAHNYGDPVDTPYGRVHLFPSPERLSDVSEDALRKCGLGYRTPYVADATDRVVTGKLDLSKIATLDSDELLTKLQSVHGVGIKVANCVALFAYGRMECAPVDVWISRAIDEECDGVSPFPMYGTDAGIIQQYIFYYMKHR